MNLLLGSIIYFTNSIVYDPAEIKEQYTKIRLKSILESSAKYSEVYQMLRCWDIVSKDRDYSAKFIQRFQEITPSIGIELRATNDFNARYLHIFFNMCAYELTMQVSFHPAIISFLSENTFKKYYNKHIAHSLAIQDTLTLVNFL